MSIQFKTVPFFFFFPNKPIVKIGRFFPDMCCAVDSRSACEKLKNITTITWEYVGNWLSLTAFFFNWGKIILQVRKKRTEKKVLNSLRKTEYGGEGLMGLWFQKAQGITYPGGL